MTLPVETLKSVPPGKAVWNANGGFGSVLLTHLFGFLFTYFSVVFLFYFSGFAVIINHCFFIIVMNHTLMFYSKIIKYLYLKLYARSR